MPSTCTTGFIRFIFTRYSSLPSRRLLSGIKPNSGSGERYNSAAGNSSDSVSWAGADCTPIRELCGHTAEKPQQDIHNSHLPHQTCECALLTVGCLWAKSLLPICCSKLTVTPGSSYTQDWAVDLLQESWALVLLAFMPSILWPFWAVIVVPVEIKGKLLSSWIWLCMAQSCCSQCVLWVPLHNCVQNEGHSQCSHSARRPCLASHSHSLKQDLGELWSADMALGILQAQKGG